MDIVKGHGFLKPQESETDYVFGSAELGWKFPYETLCEDGQWDAYLPKFEHQARQGFETANCTAYATLNALECILRRKFNLIEDFSERYVGVMAGTEPPGNDPKTVIETIRKISGLIDEGLLPFDETVRTVGEYYSPNPMFGTLLAQGLNWNEEYELKYEYVFKGEVKNKPELIKAALRHSPLGCSVYAWALDDATGMYFKNGDDNHWTVLYGYTDKAFKIFDSYDQSHKLVPLDTDFGFVMKYYIAKKEAKKDNWFMDLIKRLFGYV